MRSTERHAPESRPRPAPRRQTTRTARPPVVMGGQGQTAHDVAWSAEVVLVAVMTMGFLGLVVALGHLTGWLA